MCKCGSESIPNVSFFKYVRLTLEELGLIRVALNQSIDSWYAINCIPAYINSIGIRDKIIEIEKECDKHV